MARNVDETQSADPVTAGEHAFVENWGGLAQAFGMARDLGRAHALIYIALEPLDESRVAERLGIPVADACRHVDELVDWGVVESQESAEGRRYLTNHDPWVWFLRIVAERHHREFVPVLQAMRRTRATLEAVKAQTAAAAEICARADRFTKFVEDLSRLIELFLRLGSKPMAAVLRTLAKIAPRT